ncbi:glycosyltransferase [Pedobacter heparinus]|nr:glycosyltransferase [Pedobacter heparinus]
MYHKVDLESPTMWWVTADGFYRQMFELQNRKAVYLDDYDPEDPDQVVITFDGVYKNVLTYAAPILHKFSYPFELFVTSDYIGKTNEFDSVEPQADFASVDDLQILQKMGGRIQWHTKSHPDLKATYDEDLIHQELTVPDELIPFEKHGLKWFAYPYGNFNDKVVAEVSKRFKGAVSCHQGSDTNIYTLNRVTVTQKHRFSDQTISCIIPCYNYGHFLAEAIESVLRQTIPADEIIIADDCSTDMTAEISLFFQKKHPDRIKYIKNPENLGIIRNFNKAVSLSTGSYLVFLGADNRFQSNYIEECAGILHQHACVGIAYTDFLFFGSRAKKMYTDSKKEYQSTVHNGFFKIQFPEAEDIDVAERLKHENFIHGSSMFRRICYEQVGGYQSNPTVPEDYNLFFSIVKSGYQIKKANKTVLHYRQHSPDQANHVFGAQVLVNIYMIKIKELETELRFLRKYKIVQAISFAFRIKNNTRKLIRYSNQHGMGKTIRKVFSRLF